VTPDTTTLAERKSKGSFCQREVSDHRRRAFTNRFANNFVVLHQLLLSLGCLAPAAHAPYLLEPATLTR
jgi:hypothetical protein